MSYSAKGRVHLIEPKKQVSEKFAVQNLIVETELDSKYPQLVQFQFSNAKTDLLEGLSVGDDIEVHFNLRGRAWTAIGGTKYFNTLEGWKVTKIGQQTGQNSGQQHGQQPAVMPENVPNIVHQAEEIADDLPF